jgi:hypothetical protein
METLLPVIVGGPIGLMGGFVGPWFFQKAKEVLSSCMYLDVFCAKRRHCKLGLK